MARRARRIGFTTFGFPVYMMNGIMVVDTGCGTEIYYPAAFGELIKTR